MLSLLLASETNAKWEQPVWNISQKMEGYGFRVPLAVACGPWSLAYSSWRPTCPVPMFLPLSSLDNGEPRLFHAEPIYMQAVCCMCETEGF